MRIELISSCLRIYLSIALIIPRIVQDNRSPEGRARAAGRRAVLGRQFTSDLWIGWAASNLTSPKVLCLPSLSHLDSVLGVYNIGLARLMDST